jgi:toxin CptA
MNLAPLLIVLKPSRLLAAILASAHASAGLVWVILPFPIWFKVIGIAVILVAGVFYVRRYALLSSPTSVRELRLLSDNRLEIFRGEWRSAESVGEQFVHPWLTIIRCHVKNDRWPISIVIMRDMLNEESFRALRVQLKWRR